MAHLKTSRRADVEELTIEQMREKNHLLLPVFRVRKDVLQEECEALERKIMQLRATRPMLDVAPSSPPSAVFVGEDDEVPDAPQSSPSLRVKLPWPRAQASPVNRATFTLDWDFSAVLSQSTLHPQAVPNARTLLARCASSNVNTALQGAYRTVRSMGFDVEVDEHDPRSFACVTGDAVSSRMVLRVTALGERFPWLCVLCMPEVDEAFETRLITSLLEGGVTTTRATSIPHSREETSKFDVTGLSGKAFQLSFTTGGDPLSTLFHLHSSGDGGLVVAKALCTYENAELGRAGPTIVLLEVAQEWRGRGIGRQLLGYVEDFCATLLLPIGLGSTRLMATGVTNGAAARWLMRRNFRGDGDELSKPLALGGAGEDESED